VHLKGGGGNKRWRRYGDNGWQNNDATIPRLASPGVFYIEFEDTMQYWAAPLATGIELTNDALQRDTFEYVPRKRVPVVLYITGANNIGRWRIEGKWYNSGDTAWVSLRKEIPKYIDFKPIKRLLSPSWIFVTTDKDSLYQFTANYTRNSSLSIRVLNYPKTQYTFDWGATWLDSNDTCWLNKGEYYYVKVADVPYFYANQQSFTFWGDTVLTFTYIADPNRPTQPPTLSIFPNPSKGNLFLQANTNGAPFTFIIADILGRVQYTAEYENQIGDKKPIDLPDLPNGIYFARLTSGTIDLKQKIIITK
jgi:hypothetical protein